MIFKGLSFSSFLSLSLSFHSSTSLFLSSPSNSYFNQCPTSQKVRSKVAKSSEQERKRRKGRDGVAFDLLLFSLFPSYFSLPFLPTSLSLSLSFLLFSPSHSLTLYSWQASQDMGWVCVIPSMKFISFLQHICYFIPIKFHNWDHDLMKYSID